MSIVELFILAVGLSMDAFAVAICIGLTFPKVSKKEPLIVGFYFGLFQAVMPLIGYMAATMFADMIIAYDHWIAFILLCFLGGKMIFVGLRERGCACEEASLKPAEMLPFAIATSIDALAIGVSLAFLRVSIVPAVLFIGVVTFLISVLGVKIGKIFGLRLKTTAELLGGGILILIGLKILIEHVT